MKLTALLLAAAAAALILAAPALAGHPKHHARWHDLTLIQKRHVVVKTIQRERSTIRWWLHTRTRLPESASGPFHRCAAIGIRAPTVICAHGQRLVKALHVLGRIDKKLDAIALAHVLGVASRDFATAARFADRIWPGTEGWLLSCSSSEGGHGEFVMNRGGSGAGGWMQFMSGTFYGNVASAFAEAVEHGVNLPVRLAKWDNPLAQAVTAAWMRYHGHDRGQWTGASC